MSRFESVLSPQEEDDVVKWSADGLSVPDIRERLGESLDHPPSESTLYRILKRRRLDVTIRATRGMVVPEPRATVRQKQRASRRAKSPGQAYEAVHHAEPLPVFPGAGPKA